tara:strand:+ start:200 stop:1054 length:855 start_codon:yes stop_codon:yes gene_type:complete
MRFRALFILILSAYICNAQTKYYNYSGTLLIKNSPPIGFTLELREKNGNVSGYSITNQNTIDETKSEVQGLYFQKNKTFQLQETQILKTKSESPINSFCYIRMNLQIKKTFNKKRLEGSFTGNFLDSIKCAEGKIILMEKSFIDKKIKRIQKKIEKYKEKEFENKQDTNHIIKTQIIKDGDDFNINWISKFLILKIWDSNQEDGDKINLTINGSLILKDYETKNRPKKIKYKLLKGNNIIKIKATSSGSSPPNTSRIELIDKNKKYPILIQLDINKSAIIKINK